MRRSEAVDVADAAEDRHAERALKAPRHPSLTILRRPLRFHFFAPPGQGQYRPNKGLPGGCGGLGGAGTRPALPCTKMPGPSWGLDSSTPVVAGERLAAPRVWSIVGGRSSVVCGRVFSGQLLCSHRSPYRMKTADIIRVYSRL